MLNNKILLAAFILTADFPFENKFSINDIIWCVQQKLNLTFDWFFSGEIRVNR